MIAEERPSGEQRDVRSKKRSVRRKELSRGEVASRVEHLLCKEYGEAVEDAGSRQ